MIIEIPGYKTLDLDYLVLDYNGTIAVDGLIPPAIKERLLLLGDSFKIYVLTADTEIMTFPSGSAMNEKLRILSSLGAEHCIAIGNGRNDVPMCQAAALSIAVMGTEGAYGKLLSECDVCTTSIADALDLLMLPKRLVATLRG